MFTPSFDPAVAARPRLEGGAFTLIELLVSMTVTLLLVVALMQIFNAAASTWQHGEAQVDAYREARGALQLMARDLSTTLQASYSQTSSTTPANYYPTVPTLVLQHASASYDPNGGPVNEEVYCLTNIPNNDAIPTPATTATNKSILKMSSLCAVGYYCQWMPDPVNASASTPPPNTPHAFALMRQSLDSNGTSQRLQAAAGTQLTFDNLFSRQSAPAPVVNQLAAYIWDLRFRIDTDLNEQNPADGNLPSPGDHSTPQRLYSAGSNTQHYPASLPPYVEIRFKALSEIAGRRLEGINSGVQKKDWLAGATSAAHRTIIEPNFQQFVLRVPLINAASVGATPAPTSSP